MKREFNLGGYDKTVSQRKAGFSFSKFKKNEPTIVQKLSPGKEKT
jgi:hypothetical protein